MNNNIDDEENSYYSHLQFLEEFYRLILPGINSDSLEINYQRKKVLKWLVS